MEYFNRIRALGRYPPWSLCSLLVELLAAEGLDEEADETFADILAHGVLPTEACATMMIRLRVQVLFLSGLASGEGGETPKTISGQRSVSYGC